MNFKKELVFIKIFISILVIKLNVLCKLKKKQRCWQWLLLKLIQIQGFFNETTKWQSEKIFLKKASFWQEL